MSVIVATSKGIPVPLTVAKTTGTGDPVAIPITSRNIVLDLRAVGTVTGGTILVEEAGDATFTGTWSLIYTYTPVTNTWVVNRPTAGLYRFVRARFTADVTGGATVSIDVTSN